MEATRCADLVRGGERDNEVWAWPRECSTFSTDIPFSLLRVLKHLRCFPIRPHAKVIFNLLPSTPVRCDTPVLAHPSSPSRLCQVALPKGGRGPWSTADKVSKHYVPGVNCMTEGSKLWRERDSGQSETRV